jgi:hypothetical protein
MIQKRRTITSARSQSLAKMTLPIEDYDRRLDEDVGSTS